MTNKKQRPANITRIEESPPKLKLIEENKKALIIKDRGFLSARGGFSHTASKGVLSL